MKKIALLLVLVSLSIYTYAQVTTLDRLKRKIINTIEAEMPKYNNFGVEPRFRGLVIVNLTEKEGQYVVDGEFTYESKYPPIKKTLKYQAIVKVILDDFSVIKIIYMKDTDGEWYRLFPENEFISN